MLSWVLLTFAVLDITFWSKFLFQIRLFSEIVGSRFASLTSTFCVWSCFIKRSLRLVEKRKTFFTRVDVSGQNFVVKLYCYSNNRTSKHDNRKLTIRFKPNHSRPNLKSSSSLAAISTGPPSQGPLGQITRIPGPPPGPGANICALVRSRRAGGRRGALSDWPLALFALQAQAPVPFTSTEHHYLLEDTRTNITLTRSLNKSNCYPRCTRLLRVTEWGNSDSVFISSRDTLLNIFHYTLWVQLF